MRGAAEMPRVRIRASVEGFEAATLLFRALPPGYVIIWFQIVSGRVEREVACAFVQVIEAIIVS